MLSENALSLIRTTLAAQVLNYYGQAERVAMAYRWNEDKWAFVPAYGKVELHGKDDIYEIIATGFWNTRMPLIRYLTNDLVRIDGNETGPELLATAMAPIPDKPTYKPTRLEYFSVQILQGLIIGRSDQILPKITGRAISLAKELELALDVEQNL